MRHIMPSDAEAVLKRILEGRGCPAVHAVIVAHEIVCNSLEGTYSHGINRFPRLVRNIEEGIIDMEAEPVLERWMGGIERYDGRCGFGIVNACICMDRAIELAETHGIGCVALRNTNHWFRAATYGYQACARGMAGICFTNTMPNMPTWGASDPRLGNNPLVFAFPWKDGDIVVDMAMSQYSYGALEVARLKGTKMPYPAGFDAEGNLTTDPEAVLASKRGLPIGYWKGAALSFALDIFAAALSLGNSTAVIRRQGNEYGLSQVFIAININAIAPREEIERIIEEAVSDLATSKPDGSGTPIVYPGQRRRTIRERNLAEGIPVDERVWDEIIALERT